ncbi:Sugar-specific transcriptional regulator TrmB [uncultured archaeon]|nr:Sugar-specific transcriptional regulator TrmB [uncultured archaeon]
MPKDLDYKIKKLEKGPLQRFKNQNAVLKKFGEDALRLYKAASGKKTAEEIIAELGIEADFAAEVIAWMEERGMVELLTVEGGAVERPAKKEETPEEKEERAPKPAPKKAIAAQEEEPEIRVPKPRSRLREIVEQEQREEEEKPEKRETKPEKKKEEIVPVEDEIKPEPPEEEETGEGKGKPAEEEIKHEAEEEEEPETKEEGEGEIVPVEEERAEPAKEEEEKTGEEEEIKPAEEEEEKAAVEEEEEKPPAEGEEIEPESQEAKEEREEEEIAPEEGSDLNPVEKTIVEKYGDVGLKVYALIDGQKTAEEIMNETGVSEAKLIEMLEFMEKQGIIKLEHPEAKAAEEAEEEKEKFAPLADQGAAGQMKDMNPVEVPSKIQIDMFKGIQMRAKIALQYGEKGGKIFDSIDGKASDVDLSLKLGIPLYEVRDALSFLSSNRIITTRPLNREDITHRYGEDCFAVYKRYGREGVLLYELIGKDMSIRQMAQLVTKEKQKFAEMFIFVHKVLGVDIPIDKDVIYSQLGEAR